MSLIRGQRNCPICMENIRYNSIVIVSPWIRERIKTKKIFSRMGTCESCKGAIFNFRYSENQMKLLYQNYRDRNYKDLRFKWEKWYGDKFNDGHLSENYIGERKKELDKFLIPNLPDNFKSVVDIGGGRGELIPELITSGTSSTQRYVIDISNVSAINNVTKIKSLNEVGKVDLIIYSHTIEHVVDPLFVLKNMLQYTDNIYIETPNGVPRASFVSKSILINIIFAAMSFSPRIWRNLFSTSVGLKHRHNVLRQSEHINFFQVETLNKLAELCDCDSIVQLNFMNNPLGEKHEVIQAIFRKRPNST